MTGSVLDVHASTDVRVVGLTRAAHLRIGPVLDAAITQLSIRAIGQLVVEGKRVMLT